MRRIPVIAAALALSLVPFAAPAAAAEREITKRSCEKQGGTYTRANGVSTCKTTQVSRDGSTVTTKVVSQAGRGERRTISSTSVVVSSTSTVSSGNGAKDCDLEFERIVILGIPLEFLSSVDCS